MVDNKTKLVIWNARSIRKKALEFYYFMWLKDIHIALISETHLRDSDSIYNSNYKVYRLDRGGNRRGGGVALVIKKGVAHEPLSFLQTKVIEAIAIEIYVNGRRVVIVSAYFPGSNDADVLASFRSDLRILGGLGANVIVGADWNARHSFWGCQRSNAAGEILFQETMSGGFTIDAPNTPTHFPSSGATPSIIDAVLSKGSFEPVDVHTEDYLASDHLPVVFELSDSAASCVVTERSIPDLSRANWSRFGNYISQKLNSSPSNPLLTTSQIDDAVNLLETVIKEADTHAIPRKTVRPNRTTLSPEIVCLIGRRRAANRRWKRTHDQQDRQTARSLTLQVESALDHLVNSRFSQSVSKIDREPGPFRKKFWRLVKNLRNRSNTIPPLRTQQGTLVTATEKCEAFASHFEEVSNAGASGLRNTRLEREVKRSVETIDNLQLTEIPEITMTALKTSIACLKPGKAPGIDGVTNRHLKHLPDTALQFTLSLFNACLKLGYFPTRWKESVITCICKPGKPRDQLASYRFLSLLPCPGKLLEYSVLDFTNAFLDDNNIIIPQQYGFRKGKGCTHQLYRIVKLIKRGLYRRLITGMLSLDLTCAFDCVWHEALLHKMLSLNFPIFLLKIIRSFLFNRTFSVAVNGVRSSPRRVKAGVPQGAVTSPTFFNVFFHDIPLPPNGEVAQLADDTAFLASSSRVSTVTRRLQNASTKFTKYFKRWRVRVNSTKSKAVLFTRKTATRHRPLSRVKVGDEEIEWSDDLVYLGMNLDKRATHKKHVMSQILATNKTIKSLYSIIGRNSRLSVKHKLLLFKTVFRPRFMYAAPVWRNTALTHRKQLQILQNKILKIMLNKPRRFPTALLHSITGIETVQQYIDKTWLKFEQNCNYNSNPDIVSLIADPY